MVVFISQTGRTRRLLPYSLLINWPIMADRLMGLDPSCQPSLESERRSGTEFTMKMSARAGTTVLREVIIIISPPNCSVPPPPEASATKEMPDGHSSADHADSS